MNGFPVCAVGPGPRDPSILVRVKVPIKRPEFPVFSAVSRVRTEDRESGETLAARRADTKF